MVDEGAKAPKSCLLPGEMRTTMTADGLLSTGTPSTSTRAICLPPPRSWSLSVKTKKRTSWAKFNQLATLYWRIVIQAESRQTLLFDPGGCLGRLYGYPFLRGRRALRGGFVWDAAMVSDDRAVLLSVGLQHHIQEKGE